MRLRLLPVSLLVLPLMAAAILPAHAQQSDLRPVLDRLDRAERDITTLQRQVYRGGGSSASSSSSSSSSPGAAAPTGDSSDAIVSIQERLNRIEDTQRTLTGRLEELGHLQQLNAERMDRMSKDYDLRFSEMEQKLNAAQQAPAQGQAGPVPQLNPPPELTQSQMQKPGESSIVLKPPAGSLEASAKAAKDTPQAAKPPPPSAQAAGNPQDQYDKAFGLLRGGDYEAAEKSFTAFIQANPNDALTGNAQYWLGETFYARGDHQKAAVAFAEGYQKYPKSPKAPDNLLKLGLSLDALGQKKEACTSYARLLKEFKTVSSADSVKRKAQAEMQRLGCK